jgi:LysM repeat protein
MAQFEPGAGGGDVMGLFKFIKDAGAKLFGGGAQAATSDDLKKTIDGHGFDSGKLNIDVQGDRVKLSGQAMTQEEAEKIILSLGNTIGIAQVDTSGLQVQQPAPEATMYTVQKGDTLWEIAEKHYGKGKGAKYTEIVKANSPPVKDPDMIQPGWVLRIPPLAA